MWCCQVSLPLNFNVPQGFFLFLVGWEKATLRGISEQGRRPVQPGPGRSPGSDLAV